MAQLVGVCSGFFGVGHPLNWDLDVGFGEALSSMRCSPSLSALFHPSCPRPGRGGTDSCHEVAVHQGRPEFNLTECLSRCGVAVDLATVYASVSLVDQILAEEHLGDEPLDTSDELPSEKRLRDSRNAIGSLCRTYWDCMCDGMPLGHTLEDSDAAEASGWMPPMTQQRKAMLRLMALQCGEWDPSERVAVGKMAIPGLLVHLGFSPDQASVEGSNEPCVAARRPLDAVNRPCSPPDRASPMQGLLSHEIRCLVDCYLEQDAAHRSSRGNRARVDEARKLLCLLLGIPAAYSPTTLREAALLMDPLIPHNLCLRYGDMGLGVPGRTGLGWSRWRLRNYSKCLALRLVFSEEVGAVDGLRQWASEC